MVSQTVNALAVEWPVDRVCVHQGWSGSVQGADSVGRVGRGHAAAGVSKTIECALPRFNVLSGKKLGSLLALCVIGGVQE